MFQPCLDKRSNGSPARRIEDAVAAYLNDSFASDARPLAHLDRWSQQRITVSILSTVRQMLDAGDPIHSCDANLVREIHAEARSGVFLATPAGNVAQLQRLSGGSGMSGRLFQHMPRIAPVLFADDLQHFNGDIDLVWAMLESRFYRANLRAEVWELVLMYVLDTEASVSERVDALRRTFYTWREDQVRRTCNLSHLLDDRDSQQLDTIVSGLLAGATA